MTLHTKLRKVLIKLLAPVPYRQISYFGQQFFPIKQNIKLTRHSVVFDYYFMVHTVR